MVITKSPLTGALTCANSGGEFPTEMKRTGFDMILLEGRSPRPVYLWINDNGVELRAAGHHETLWLHGAMEAMCRLYEDHGVPLGDLRLVSDATKDQMRGHIVIAPPSALNDRWSRRLPDPITAMASGWMRVRQRARQRGVELPLVISDHADWSELTRTITQVNPQETWVTHGREEALLRWCELSQRRARALALVGYEDDDD